MSSSVRPYLPTVATILAAILTTISALVSTCWAHPLAVVAGALTVVSAIWAYADGQPFEMMISPDSWVLESVDPASEGGVSHLSLTIPAATHGRGRNARATVYQSAEDGFDVIGVGERPDERGNIRLEAAIRFAGKVVIAR